MTAKSAGISVDVNRLADGLESVLLQLAELQERIRATIADKLDAMRRADTEGIEAASGREGVLAGAVANLDGRRREIVGRLCETLAVPTVRGDVSLRTVASRLEPTRAERLLALAAALRERMLRAAEANRVVDMVCREMLGHFRELFTIIARGPEEPATYSARGRSATGDVRVLDAVV